MDADRDQGGRRSLSFKVDSWQNGVNRNVDRRTVRRVLGYNGNGVHFRRTTDEVAKAVTRNSRSVKVGKSDYKRTSAGTRGNDELRRFPPFAGPQANRRSRPTTAAFGGRENLDEG